MLFHILPIPIPEIKLGLPLEALSVLWIPRLTVLHSVNTCMKLNILWQGVATLPDNGNVMHYLLQIFCLCIYVLISVRSKPVIWMKRYGAEDCKTPVRQCQNHFCSTEFTGEKTSPFFAPLSCGKATHRQANSPHSQCHPLNIFPPVSVWNGPLTSVSSSIKELSLSARLPPSLRIPINNLKMYFPIPSACIK